MPPTSVPPAESPSQTPLLASLLGPGNVDRFLEEFWTEKLFVVHGPFDRIRDFVYESFDEVLAHRTHHVTAFFHSLDDVPGQLTPTAAQIPALYQAGFTLYLHGFHAPRTDALAAAANQELGLVPGGTRIAAFASRKGKGLVCHYDYNDNLVIQARGTKRWHIAPNRHVKWPSATYSIGQELNDTHRIEAPDGFPASPDDIEGWETVETRPGSVMYLPRGWWHYTETTDDESLHFNIQTGLVRWQDLAHYVLLKRVPIGGLEMREALWNLFEDGTLRPEYREVLREQLQNIVASLTDDDFAVPEEDFDAYLALKRGS